VGTILTSTVIAAIVAAVAFWAEQRRISIENITQDRRAWREKIREKAFLVHDSLISRNKKSLNRLKAEFSVLLNPKDEDDKEIISCIKLTDDGQEIELANKFAERIALLLKHDWERVRLEAGPLIMRVKGARKPICNSIFQSDREKYERTQ